MIKTVTTVAALRTQIKQIKHDKQRVAFVPTMGNLHEGHIALVKAALACCDYVVVSIFVNPTQFGEGEDFDSYPRTLDADIAKLAAAGAQMVFVPGVDQMYPDYPQHTTVTVGTIANQLCGKRRVGHFDGVATVVTKLLGMVTADVAFFGQKDYQQLAVIRQVVADLAIDTEIVGVPTVRAADGLALSSRNGYLSDTERASAALLSQSLNMIGERLCKGERDYAQLEQSAQAHLNASGFVVDYIRIATVQLGVPTAQDSTWVVLVAAQLGTTRLIDNMSFTAD